MYFKDGVLTLARRQKDGRECEESRMGDHSAYFEPQRVLYSADIWTADTLLPRAQAVRMTDGRFLAVRSTEDYAFLGPAKLSYLVVLGRDPFLAYPSSLIPIPIERTMV
jgi:hypothetical protein